MSTELARPFLDDLCCCDVLLVVSSKPAAGALKGEALGKSNTSSSFNSTDVFGVTGFFLLLMNKIEVTKVFSINFKESA